MSKSSRQQNASSSIDPRDLEFQGKTSGRRFDAYRDSLRQRHAGKEPDKQNDPSAPTDSASNRGDAHPRKLGDAQRGTWQLLVQFWRLLSGHHRRILAGGGLLTISTLLALIPPVGTKLAIDSVLSDPPQPIPDWASWLPFPQSPMGRLVMIALIVTAVTLLATMVRLWSRWLGTKSVNMAQVSIRKRVFEHAVKLPLDKVHKMRSGGVASLIREDAGGVADLIFSMLYNPYRAILQFVGSLIVLVMVDWQLMVGGLALAPAVYFTHRTWITRVRPLFRDVRKQRQSIDAGATETFGGIRVVRTFARGHNETARYVREGDFLVRQQLFTWWWTRTIEIIWEVIIPLASTVLLLYGGYQILSGSLTLGDLMMFLIFLTMLLDPLATLAGSAVSFQNNLAGLDRILDVLEEPAELPTRDDPVTLQKSNVDGAVSIRNVSFAYESNQDLVLRDIQLEVDAGQTVALVGRSGAGKTTLTNLVARFYDPASGSIHLDRRDLREIELESYRRLLGIVEQDVFLFDGSIRENIMYGRRGASDEELFAAAGAAAAHDFISKLPDGYDSIIGERGVKLSGGQRQRIAIARAILADPRILILDEATSNLDSESERLIQDSLQQLLQNRTAFVIAHRLSTIINADLIVVLEDGMIVQQGTHQALLETEGPYRDMVALQMDHRSVTIGVD